MSSEYLLPLVAGVIEITVFCVLLAVAGGRARKFFRAAPAINAAAAPPAGFILRFAAFWIDMNLTSLAAILLIALLIIPDALRAMSPWFTIPALSAGALFLLGYFVLPVVRRGQTAGKRWTGIAVETTGGGTPGMGRALVRFLLTGASVFLAGYFFVTLLGLLGATLSGNRQAAGSGPSVPLMAVSLLGMADLVSMFISRDRRALHDVLCGTRVRQTVPPGRLLTFAPLFISAANLLLIGVVALFLCHSYLVASDSMDATFFAGDKVLANRLAYRLSSPRRGDLIVFTDAKTALLIDPASSRREPAIKRLIALPGDTVRIQRDKGVFLNGELLTEPYVVDVPHYDWPLASNGLPAKEPYRVPAGQCFVLGDNRNQSADSHTWRNPATGKPAPDVPLSAITGRIFVRFSPGWEYFP